MSDFDKRSTNLDRLNPGPHFARVVSHIDPLAMGSLRVQLARPVGNQAERPSQIFTAKYLNPFYGKTDIIYNTKNDGFNDTQKSYGMWFVPPDPGATVLVIFVNGDPSECFWLGCVMDLHTNFMLPGHAATKYNIPDKKHKIVVPEFNRILKSVIPDSTSIPKPQHPITETLKLQGLFLDEIRGITTSSARRESPSHVFGISTPGPRDKNGPVGPVGPFGQKIDIPISRLGGSTFVMDDGDERWCRKSSPSDEGPNYRNMFTQKDGDVTRPHNELVRIRTRTGHQILMHNAEDLIYIGNSRGTSWIELSSDGKIDIFAQDSVSIRTKQDFNFYADRDINFEAGRNLNIMVRNEMHTEVKSDLRSLIRGNCYEYVGAEWTQKTDSNVKFQFNSDFDMLIAGHNWQTSGGTNETRALTIIETAGVIHMNGPEAATAVSHIAPFSLETHALPEITTQGSTTPVDLSTILRRVPSPEPWPHHENLEPKMFKPDKTDRDSQGRLELVPIDNRDISLDNLPGFWKSGIQEENYFTPDTFNKGLYK